MIGLRVSGFERFFKGSILRGSWVGISGVISKVTVLITHIKGLITLLITTHEPPSRFYSGVVDV